MRAYDPAADEGPANVVVGIAPGIGATDIESNAGTTDVALVVTTGMGADDGTADTGSGVDPLIGPAAGTSDSSSARQAGVSVGSLANSRSTSWSDRQ